MNRYEHMGYWWLPVTPKVSLSKIPESAVPGRLSFDPGERGSLMLMGDFADPSFQQETSHYEIIHGSVLVKGRGKFFITLRDCYVRSRQGIGEPRETLMRVDYMFWTTRGWFHKTEDIVFDRVVVNYTHLSDWLSQRNFRSHIERHDSDRRFIKRVRYLSPKPIEIQVDSATIKVEAELSSMEDAGEVSLKESRKIVIAPQDKLSFDEYLQFIDFHLPSFLTLATGHANYPISVEGQILEDHGKTRVYIHYGILGYKERNRPLTSNEMLFSLRDVEDRLTQYLSSWIGKSEKLQTTLELYLKSYFEEYWDIRTQFLDLARALEAYHRNLYGGEFLSEQDYKPIKEALTNAIPTCVSNLHRDALIGRLNYGYEFSFRARLKRIVRDILRDHEVDLRCFVGKPSLFVTKVVQLRNQLTHPDERDVAPDPLRDLIPKMQMLLRICLLVEMDFPSSEITRLLSANQEYRQLAKGE